MKKHQRLINEYINDYIKDPELLNNIGRHLKHKSAILGRLIKNPNDQEAVKEWARIEENEISQQYWINQK